MALVKGTNSYVTVVEATAYFEDRSNAEVWNGASATAQEQALVTAADILDTLPWVGSSAAASQNMAFPRTGSYTDPGRGRVINFESSATEAPLPVKKGQYELAYHILNNDTLLEDTGSVQDLALAGIGLVDIVSPSLLPGAVRRFINPLLKRGSSRGVFVGG